MPKVLMSRLPAAIAQTLESLKEGTREATALGIATTLKDGVRFQVEVVTDLNNLERVDTTDSDVSIRTSFGGGDVTTQVSSAAQVVTTEAGFDSTVGTDIEASSDTGVETGISTEVSSDTGIETGTTTETSTNTGTETGTTTETSTDTGTETGTTTETSTDTGTETGSSSETSTDTGTETGSSSETSTDTGTDRKSTRLNSSHWIT